MSAPANALARPRWDVAVGSLVLVASGLLLVDGATLRPALLLLIGTALGVTLYLATFGFASAYRELFTRGRTDGLIAQALMIGLATVAFAPFLALGEAFGQPVIGAYAPLAVSVAVGATLFGVGMQLAGGCGSGTLFTIGGGSGRMVLVLLAFCAGSFGASLHMDWWQRLPSADPIVLGQIIGWGTAAALQVAVLALVAALLWRRAEQRWRLSPSGSGWWRGPWPLAFGAVALAALNLATLVTAGHPWTITWAFTLWGAKAATLIGWDPATSAFWAGGFPRRALALPLLTDTTTIMDIGIMMGALLAAALSGRFNPRLNLTLRSAATAVIGGLLMGYGSRIAYGCNIGAFFSGAASTSLHGWLWFACALAGSAMGVRLQVPVTRAAYRQA